MNPMRDILSEREWQCLVVGLCFGTIIGIILEVVISKVPL